MKSSMKEAIERFIQSKHIAIVGASGSPKKFGGQIVTALQAKGYTIYPVNPNRDMLGETKCFKSLHELPPEVDAALFVLPARYAENAVEEAAAGHIRRIWFQQGANYSKAAALAAKSGIETVVGKCIFMYVPPVEGFHAFHRFVARLFRIA